MTWLAPIRVRILPCDGVIALTQRCSMPRSTRLTVISTEDSMEVPTPTTAELNSWAPSWRSASMLVASASTTWVRRGAHFCTRFRSRSMASTSRPCLTSCSAVDDPKRPSPITSTGALWAGRLTAPEELANDRSLFRVVVQLAALAQGQAGGKGDRPDAPGEHEQSEDVNPRRRQLCTEVGAEAHSGEGGNGFKQDPVQGGMADVQEQEGRDRDEGGDGDHHGDGGDLDAAGRGCGTSAGEHEGIGEQHGGGLHVVLVHEVEAAGAQHD